MKPKHTELVFIVDRSGSMSTIRQAMETGYRKLIEEQRQVKGSCDVTLVQFDDKYERVFERVPIDAGLCSELHISPRGYTALYDAIGRTITEVGERLAATKESKRPEKIIVTIITDGHENASHEWDHRKVKAAIEHQKSKYSWDFVFLGGEPDAVEEAKTIGIVNAAAFQPNQRGTQALFGGISKSYAATRGGVSLDFNQTTYDTALNNEQ